MPAIDTPPTPIHYQSPVFDLSATRDTPDRDLDLHTVAAALCVPAAPDDMAQAIVVCAKRRTIDHRLPPLTTRYDVADGLPRAEMGLGGNAVVGVHAETVMINNAKSDRMMVTYTLKF